MGHIFRIWLLCHFRSHWKSLQDCVAPFPALLFGGAFSLGDFYILYTRWTGIVGAFVGGA